MKADLVDELRQPVDGTMRSDPLFPLQASSSSGLSDGPCSNIARGVMYHSKKRMAAPYVNNVVVSGTFKKICGRIPPDNRMNLGGKPDDRRLPRAITSPHVSPAIGAKIGPTEAMPSVANREALKFPS